MAQPTNTFDTYDMSGIREQLSDIIYNISPTDTPMFSSMGKGKLLTLSLSGLQTL